MIADSSRLKERSAREDMSYRGHLQIMTRRPAIPHAPGYRVQQKAREGNLACL
jgi:hypothetical protein